MEAIAKRGDGWCIDFTDFRSICSREFRENQAKEGGINMEWCPRCERTVDVEHKVRKLGRSKSLVKVTSTCTRCRTTLSTKTMTAQAAEEIIKEEEERKAEAQVSKTEETEELKAEAKVSETEEAKKPEK
jgi:valyl-tRNA synthetase